MKKATKMWLITAASLVVIGCLIFGSVMSMLDWDFTQLSTNKYETNTYEIGEQYHDISIVSDTAAVVLVPSESAATSIVCYEQENVKHTVAVQDGELVIKVKDERKWYEYIGVNFGGPKITVSIPQGEYGKLTVKTVTGNVTIPSDFTFESIAVSGNTGNITSGASAATSVAIKTTTGHIAVDNMAAGSLDLSVSTGGVTVSDVTCEGDIKVGVSTGKAALANVTCSNMTSVGSTGNLSLQNVVATGMLTVKRSTGNVKFDGCDAAEIFAKTDTGNVSGSLLSSKVFVTRTDTGRVDVPFTVTGGRCEIITDTGNIKITVTPDAVK